MRITKRAAALIASCLLLMTASSAYAQNGYKKAFLEDREWGLPVLSIMIPASWKSISQTQHWQLNYTLFFQATSPNAAESYTMAFLPTTTNTVTPPDTIMQSFYLPTLQQNGVQNIQPLKQWTGQENFKRGSSALKYFYLLRYTKKNTPYIAYCCGYTAPFSILLSETSIPYRGNQSIQRAMRIGNTIYESKTDNPQWVALFHETSRRQLNQNDIYRAQALDRSRRLAAEQDAQNAVFRQQTINQGAAAINQSREYRRQSDQYTNMWTNIFTGQTDVYDPSTGKYYKVDDNKYHYKDQNGNIYNTNTNMPAPSWTYLPQQDPYNPYNR